ncbi:hypothetical protein [Hallella bergensis]|uniref:hypothetical protein n=1 Tax=Hallella bergensis TaxID=242750 RepID=UPI003990AA00
MRHLNRIAIACCTALIGIWSMTGCEGGDLYDVNAPDWISQKIDSIESAKSTGEDEPLVGMQEDVYTFGATDFSSGFWQAFSKYYVVPDGEKWNAVFNLNINPGDNTYYKNFALIVCSDAARGEAGYVEYGAYRFDATGDSAKYNSQWGNHLFFKYTNSTLLLSPDKSNADANVQKLGGKITLTVDRSKPDSFLIKITNGVATKTYTQPYKLPNLNTNADNNNIRCFICVDGSYIDFMQTNIVPIGGTTSAMDKAPISMELQNVPDEVDRGTPLDSAMANVSALVTFEEGVTKTVPAAELYFSAIPDMEDIGKKTLVAIYNKTFKGENAAKPVVSHANFNVVAKISAISVTQSPFLTHYYFCKTAATNDLTDRTLAFDPAGLEVTATYADGSTSVMNNAKLKFSPIPATAGVHRMTITTKNGKQASVNITVSESEVTTVEATPKVLGPTDNSGAWWSAHTDNIFVPAGKTRAVNFTNYSSMANNWKNFVVVLRTHDNATEYGVLRSDNYGWGNGYAAVRSSTPPSDWATWLPAMNGAKITVYVTNCNNGTADVQAVIKGSDGKDYKLYYLGLNTVDVDDLNFAFTIDACHLEFGAASAKKHNQP